MSAPEHALAAGWPLAITVAALLVRSGMRARRRRGALNRALHELRRPLQAAALLSAREVRGGAPGNGSGQPAGLDLALAALDELDREINGGDRVPRLRPVACLPVVEGSVSRWRAAAGRSSPPVELRWRAGTATVLADPQRLAQAIDNLIANAIEHGGPPIRVEAAVSGARVRITVLDGGRGEERHARRLAVPRRRFGALGFARRLRTGGRRGRGLEVVTRIAAEHGGRFVLRRGAGGAAAALELPLAALPAPDAAPVAA